MKTLIEKASGILDRYSNLEGYEDEQEIEGLLEDAMNVIAEFVERKKAE